MKKILFVLILFSKTLRGQDCGVERWSIKTLSDPDTLKINFSNPIKTSVSQQVAISRPNIERNKRHKSETYLYKIDCSIVGYKREDGDKDIHIIIEDDETEETMVAEIPSHNCKSIQHTSREGLFFELNKWFVVNIGYPTNSFTYLKKHIPVTLTGVGFFDYVHGQVGMASNGREIHPVLSISKR